MSSQDHMEFIITDDEELADLQKYVDDDNEFGTNVNMFDLITDVKELDELKVLSRKKKQAWLDYRISICKPSTDSALNAVHDRKSKALKDLYDVARSAYVEESTNICSNFVLRKYNMLGLVK